jgi:hypothetical protein
MRSIIFGFFLTISGYTYSDWHTGKINHIGVGYNGSTVTIRVEGWTRNNCTCYTPWPDYMCLDETRATANFERSLILAARARGSKVKVNIEETSCKVIAIYEDND